MKPILFSIFAVCLWTAAGAGEMEVPELSLARAYVVEGPGNFQPSGLTIVGGRLYTVSDKHDAAIYALNFDGERAAAVPAIPIPRPPGAYRKLDLEGITHDENGYFYLASETMANILRVSADGATADWMAPDLRKTGKAAGLFQVKNAGLEAICRIGDGKFLVCGEREPRGFAIIDLAAVPPQIHAWRSDESRFSFPKGVSHDFSGLCLYQNAVYVLERNAFAVCRLTSENNRFREGPGWSYGHVETAPEFRYEDMRYGKAEGLCIDDRFIYILLDNNAFARADDPKDQRPLLLVFRHPDDFSP